MKMKDWKRKNSIQFTIDVIVYMAVLQLNVVLAKEASSWPFQTGRVKWKIFLARCFGLAASNVFFLLNLSAFINLFSAKSFNKPPAS